MMPIYRAKEKNSDEYAIGYYMPTLDNRHFIHAYIEIGVFEAICTIAWVEIDLSTLAINFPDMIDKDDTKIFASLSKDGKGGDCLKSHSGENARLVYKENTMQWDIYTQYGVKTFGLCSIGHLKLSKVTGIQE